ncbi:MAG: hypothetical protein ABIP71_04640 [Verrucomicrobiota bacterium]
MKRKNASSKFNRLVQRPALRTAGAVNIRIVRVNKGTFLATKHMILTR